MTIGVLGLQGTFIEHYETCINCGVDTILVKRKEDLDRIDGIILPGGESTTIAKLLKIFGLYEPLKLKIQKGLPVYGTCAGLIILAKEIIGETSCLDAIDITVRRNAFGSQIASFHTLTKIDEFCEEPLTLVFIRAPWIEKVGSKVKVVATYQNKIIAAREKNVLVTSFHPEFTDELAVHRYFIEMVKEHMETLGK